MKQRNADKYIKEADGVFEVRVTCEMKGQYFERRKRGIPSKGEARFVANQLLDERDEFRQQIKSGQVSWANAVAEWEIYSRSKGHSETTIYSAKLTLQKHTAVWDRKPVSAITQEEIDTLIHSSLAKEQVETKKSLLKHIRAVLRRQIHTGKIKMNPSNGVQIESSNLPMKKMEAMTRSEILKLLDEAKLQNHPWYPVWRITYELGLRSGEAYGLKWEDFNFDSCFVTIRRSFNNKTKTYKSPKDDEARSIPINGPLRDFLIEMKKTSAEKEFVFKRNNIWAHGEQAKILRAFQRQIGIKQTNFHSLRASFITHLLLAGVPLIKVMTMVGHSRMETTEVYMKMVAADTIGATDVLKIKD
ncbi:MAG: tyrosine-type recombinase/integrase [Bdellovibrionales bacterium]